MIKASRRTIVSGGADRCSRNANNNALLLPQSCPMSYIVTSGSRAGMSHACINCVWRMHG
eukprot:7741540-Pyramimonas_sp.AAC.1